MVGYGNDLRGDDAAGPGVVSAVAALALENVSTRVVHQLTPELAEEISRVRAVIFADAAVDSTRVEVRALGADGSAASTFEAHRSDPQKLVALSQTLFGRRPPAWLVTVPAHQLEVGAPMSAATAAGVQTAVREIQDLIRVSG